MRYAIAFSIFFGLVACTSAGKHTQNVCTDSPALSCLTEVRCDYDEARGCNVCYCYNAPADSEGVSDYTTGGYTGE